MAINVEQYYRSYGPMVLRRCRSILKDEEAAADAMQDTFVQLLRHQERLEGSAVSSLLYTIATNVCLNRIRSQKRDRVHAVGDELERLACCQDHTDRVLTGLFTDRLLASQTASTRAIAVCYYQDGMTLEETARTFGLSISGVRKRLQKLRTFGRSLSAA